MTSHILQVGDVLINSHCTICYKIERVTPSQAISGSARFKRESSMSWKRIGDNGWGCAFFSLATEESKAIYRKKRYVSKCERIQFRDLSIEQLEAIAAIAYPEKQEAP